MREAVVITRKDRLGDASLVSYVILDSLRAQATIREAQPLIAAERIKHWQQVYETFDQQNVLQNDTISDFSGWTSSYTGQPIVLEEMQVWQEDILALVRAYHPQSILEIGCGTGLLLFPLVAQCSHYYGTDFSAPVLHTVSQRLSTLTHLQETVTLLQRPADDFSGLPEGQIDTILINSVIQYFPDVSYLLRVLEGALHLVVPGGRIIIGDVRSFPLLEAFHASVQLAHAPETLTRQQLWRQVQQRVQQEEELTLDPAFFQHWARSKSSIQHVEVRIKRGRYWNEMTQFRYQVILHVGEIIPMKKEGRPPLAEELNWSEQGMTLQHLHEKLAQDQPSRLRLLQVPNARIEEATQTLKWLKGEPGPETVQAWRARLSTSVCIGVEPDDVREQAEQLGYDVTINWGHHGINGSYTVLLAREHGEYWGEDEEEYSEPMQLDEPIKDWQRYANHPLRAEIERLLAPQIRQYLHERLPEYMVPTTILVVDAWPVTPNGKLDRQALPLPQAMQMTVLPSTMVPRTNTEALLTMIWEQVLGRTPIGIFENFFDLGGHSLLAVQLVARIRQVFALDVPVRLFFDHPTIAQVAQEVEHLQRDLHSHQMPALLPVSRMHPLPATFDQQRLWFLDRLHPNSALYTVNWVMPASDWRDREILTRSLQELVRRHESLRTTFREQEGQVVQIIAQESTLPLSVEDLSCYPPEQQAAQATAVIRDWWMRPFDLAQGPLLRPLLVCLSATEQVLVLSVHHIVFDGYSIRLFEQEVQQIYKAFAAGVPSPLPDLAIQYADYAVWQREWLQEDRLQPHLTYWKEELADAPDLLTLPSDHARPAIQRFQGALLRRTLSLELTQQIKQMSREHQVTHFITVLSSFAVLLSRYSGQEVVVIGVPIANRSRVELEPMLGFLVNTVAVCVDLRGNLSFEEVLVQVRRRLLEAQSHQEVPFERLVEELRPQRNLSYNPIFQVMFTGLDALFGDELTDEEAWIQTLMEGGLGVAKFDLILSIQEKDGKLQHGFEYNTDLFEEHTITRMAEHLRVLVQALLTHPQQHVQQLPLLTEGERVQIQEQWNATRVEEMVQPACLHELFEAQARRTPDRIALSYEDQQLSYGELDRRTNQLAHLLWMQGVGPEARVGICAERSLEMVIGLFAILKAGGAYVPLDPGYPQERLAFMVRDAQIQVLLLQQCLHERIKAVVEEELPLLMLDGEQAQWQWQSTEAIESGVLSDNLAYVIYTSGSTGVPKGAMLSHRGICNRLLWMQEAYRLGSCDRVLQKTPFSFDVSVWEFFWPLLVGAQLHVARPEGHRDPSYLAELVAHQGIGVLHFVPSMLQVFVEQSALTEHCRSVKHVICSGEALPLELQERCLQRLPDVRLHNLYGPTEASVDVSFWDCYSEAEASTVPIGQPVANTQLYILNTALVPVPVGVIGELYIGGVQLARGYLGRPELTAERFIPNPFSAGVGERMYVTGDLARYRDSGVIEYVGRRDQQVKIRGHRIEIEEIEVVLAQHPAIGSCLLFVHEVTATDKRLVAYFIARQGHEVNLSEVKEYLRQKLPEYMLPSYFVAVKEFVLTPNGKIDRKALPSPVESMQMQTEESFVYPRTETEKELAEIWMNLLGVERVGVDDDFFALGGHSLLVAYLATEVQMRWDISLMLPVVFQHKTLQALAQVIDQSIAEMQEFEDTLQRS